MEQPKLNARQRRNLRFIEALKTTGSQSYQELKEFQKRQETRQKKPSRVYRRGTRELTWWKITRRNKAKEERRKERYLKVSGHNSMGRQEEKIIAGCVDYTIEYKFRPIEFKKLTRYDFSDVVKMDKLDPRNCLYYEHQEKLVFVFFHSN